MNWRLKNLIISIALILIPLTSFAVINPSLQPSHLAGRYKNVLYCEVKNVDMESLSTVLIVQGKSKGVFTLKEVTMKAVEKSLIASLATLKKGQKIVAYVGKTGRRRKSEILYYVGAGQWYKATMTDVAGQWQLMSSADKGVEKSSNQIMFATFNGKVESLWEMMQDTAKSKAYFPAIPFERFTTKTIADFGDSLRGVAIYDINNDGRLDLFGCSSKGNRLFIQGANGEFKDATGVSGLSNTKSVSCSIADVDGDGDADLLLDDTLYKQNSGKFSKCTDIPQDGPCLSAAFVEVDGDGYPDVIVSRAGKGLSLYLNPGADGGTFEDGSEDAGLRNEENGANGSGYFEFCDWDLDGFADLAYAAGPGYQLWQNENGIFIPTELDPEGEGFKNGTAAFGAISSPAKPGFYAISDSNKKLFAEKDELIEEVTQYGNEIQDPVNGLKMAIAEDFNADGTIDLYAANQNKGGSSFYVANRGYGSFMMSEKYKSGKVFPPEIYNNAAWGIATGDVNGDGANDLLIGGMNGKLSLLINQTLADRPEKADESTTQDPRKQIETRIVTLKLNATKGAVGARISLNNDKGENLTHRWIGTNIGVGCSGPNQVSLAIRELGNYKIEINLGDGSKKEMPLVITKDSLRHQTLNVK